MTPHEQGFQAGVKAMRAQVLAYLTDPKMRESFVMMGPRVLATVAHEIAGFHPGYVKAAPPPGVPDDAILRIKRVRKATGAGLWETKVACEVSGWDEDAAIKALGGAK